MESENGVKAWSLKRIPTLFRMRNLKLSAYITYIHRQADLSDDPRSTYANSRREAFYTTETRAAASGGPAGSQTEAEGERERGQVILQAFQSLKAVKRDVIQVTAVPLLQRGRNQIRGEKAG